MTSQRSPLASALVVTALAALALVGAGCGEERCKMAGTGAIELVPATPCLVVSGVPPNTDLMGQGAPDTCEQPVLRITSTCPLPATIPGDYTPDGVAVTIANGATVEVGIRLAKAIVRFHLRYDFEIPVTIGNATVLVVFSASVESDGGGGGGGDDDDD